MSSPEILSTPTPEELRLQHDQKAGGYGFVQRQLETSPPVHRARWEEVVAGSADQLAESDRQAGEVIAQDLDIVTGQAHAEMTDDKVGQVAEYKKEHDYNADMQEGEGRRHPDYVAHKKARNKQVIANSKNFTGKNQDVLEAAARAEMEEDLTNRRAA